MNDEFTFNLMKEPWIPCLEPGGQLAGEFGVREILGRAHEFQEISTSSPLATIALHRLLIAVLHAALDGPASPDEWGGLWRAGRFETARIEPYLEKWAPRFDLFDGEHPFYQRADLETMYAKPIDQIIQELPAQDGPVFFSHMDRLHPVARSSAEAARALVTAQAFSFGGRISFRRGEDTNVEGSADGSPLVKCAVALVRGDNLHQTLLLNLHRYDRVDERPMSTKHGDKPAWERSEPTSPSDRWPDGYRDFLTWQSRRMRFIPERMLNGATGVSRVVVMKGHQFPDKFEMRAAETMVPFGENRDSKSKSPGWFPLTIKSERTLWRDSAAIFQQEAVSERSARSVSMTRPRMFDWLATLVSDGLLERETSTLDVEVFGIESFTQRLVAWRQETLPLPTNYLDEPALTIGLEWALELTESVNRILQSTVAKFAALALVPQSDEGGREADREKSVKPLLKAIDAESAYWPFLEALFLDLLRQLPDEREIVEDGQAFAGKASLAKWGADVRAVATRAMQQALSSGGTATRMLKAAAEAENLYRNLMGQRMAAYAQQTERGVPIGEELHS